jgi:hypothetical protein
MYLFIPCIYNLHVESLSLLIVISDQAPSTTTPSSSNTDQDTAATFTPISSAELSLMNPKQLGDLLTSMGVGDDVVAPFVAFVITGKMVVDGLSEDDLKEMGFTSALKRRGIMQILGQIVSSSNDGL